jgi:uncharacterized membrane protein
MTARTTKILPLALVLAAGAVYLVKYFAGAPFLYFPLLSAVALAAASCARAAAAALPARVGPDFRSERSVYAALAAIAALFFGVFATLAICRYNAFWVRMYDFGLMDQAIWNTAHGRLLEVTDQEFPFSNVSRLSTHVEVIYALFAAAYRLLPDPRILLVGQALFVCAGIVLVFFIARIVIGTARKALAVACIAALFPALQFMVLFDFHGDVLSIPFFLLSYFGYLKKKEWLFWVGLVLALLCKEYAGLAAAGYGCALVAAHRDYRRGLAAFAIGVLYFSVSFYGIVPLFNGGSESSLARLDYGAIGGTEGLGGMARFALHHPAAFMARMATLQNAESLFYLFFSLAFLPLLSPAFLLGAAPIFLKDMLFGMDIGTHHLACGIPFVFISFIYGIRRFETMVLNPRLTRLLSVAGFPWAIALAAGLIASFSYGPSPLGHRFWRESYFYAPSAHAKACETVAKRVPPFVAISVSDDLAPHLAHRQFCYVFPAPLALSPEALGRVDYVCIDTTQWQSLAPGHTGFSTRTLPLVRSAGFDSIMETGGVYLFKKRQ